MRCTAAISETADLRACSDVPKRTGCMKTEPMVGRSAAACARQAGLGRPAWSCTTSACGRRPWYPRYPTARAEPGRCRGRTAGTPSGPGSREWLSACRRTSECDVQVDVHRPRPGAGAAGDIRTAGRGRAPFAAEFAASVPGFLALHEVFRPSGRTQLCHRDLWADNVPAREGGWTVCHRLGQLRRRSATFCTGSTTTPNGHVGTATVMAHGWERQHERRGRYDHHPVGATADAHDTVVGAANPFDPRFGDGAGGLPRTHVH